MSDLRAEQRTEPLRALLDALPCLVATISIEERIEFVNDAARTWFGLCPLELRGSVLRDVWGGRRYALVKDHVSAVLAGVPQRFEQAIHTVSGETIHAQVDLMPVVTDGVPSGFHILVNDISARVVAEATLEEVITTAALLEERSRIAADMHDRVIQKLYAAGLGARRAKVSAHEAVDWIDAIADCVDQAIGELRDAVRRLDKDPEPVSVRGALSPVIRSAARWLGTEPTVSIRGPVDRLPADLIHDVLLSTARMLAVVGARTDVGEVRISLRAEDACVRLVVTDDGLPAPERTDFGAVAELRLHAVARQGSFTMQPHRPRGTVMEWTAPVVED